MRIFVFRPRPDADHTARAIRARGNEPIVAPLFEVVRLPDAAPEGPFAALVLTSGNGVPPAAEGPAEWRDLPVFTVGARTAAKAREAGLGDARSADGDRSDLLELIRRTLPAPARLLLVVAQDRHEDLPAKLTEAGYEPVVWAAYAAQAVDAFPAQASDALRERKLDAALHYSARGAETFLSLTRGAGLTEQALDLTHVALSADVAAPLIAAGASTVLVAEHPDEGALMLALDQVSARNRRSADATEASVAPQRVETDKDGMSEPRTSPTSRSGSRRAQATIDATAQEIGVAADRQMTGESQVTAEGRSAGADPAAAVPSPESVLPTEALPQEFNAPPSGASSGTPHTSKAAEEMKRRLPLPALALAGLIGGLVGAGLVLFGSGRLMPGVSAEQIAELRSRIDTLQTAATGLERRTAAATDAAAKAGTEAQAAAARTNELAKTQGPEASAIAGLSAQAQRAESAATAVGQRVEQAAARIGSVETLARTAAAPSAQALAAARIVLAERIQTAIASGQPFAGDVSALEKGGAAPAQLAPLNAVATTGAPTRDTLMAQLRTHRAMFAREVTPASGSWQDRLLGLANRIVTIRPVGDTGANDPATLPIRLENAVSGGTIVTAAGLWAQLPEPARRASAEFGVSLQKRAAADAAIAKIAQDAVTALGAAG